MWVKPESCTRFSTASIEDEIARAFGEDGPDFEDDWRRLHQQIGERQPSPVPAAAFDGEINRRQE